MLQTKQTRPYIKIEDDLKQVLNSRGKNSKNKHEQVLSLLRELERDFNIKVSKQFLRGLYDSNNKRGNAIKLNVILNKLNSQVMTEIKHRYFKEMMFKKFKAVVTDWKTKSNFKQHNQTIGLFYQTNSIKTFNIILTNPTEINQKIQNHQEMIQRARGLFSETRTQDFFNNIFFKDL